jgi:hypothetical protein
MSVTLVVMLLPFWRENKASLCTDRTYGALSVSIFFANAQPLPEISQAFLGAAASIAVSPTLAARIVSFGYPRPVVIPMWWMSEFSFNVL